MELPMFEIQKSVPIPKMIRTAPPARRKYPFEEMEVGDMFFVPHKTRNTLATHASTTGKRLGRKFLTRVAHMVPDGEGGWVPADKSDPDATVGIGVWRTE